MNYQHVSGKDSPHKIILYALSTCVWCKKTKRFLNDLGLAYNFVDYDLLEGDEKNKIEKEIEKWNPRLSFPVLVVDGEKCILGYDETKIKELVNHD